MSDQITIFYGNCELPDEDECDHRTGGMCTSDQDECMARRPVILVRVGPATAAPPGADATPVHEAIHEVCAELARFLCEKNAAYGNSFADPVRIFSKASAEEAIAIRIDDKLSRLMRGSDAGEDTELDLLGYLVLRRVLRRMTA